MGLNQKTIALTEQALTESNQTQQLIQDILTRLAGGNLADLSQIMATLNLLYGTGTNIEGYASQIRGDLVTLLGVLNQLQTIITLLQADTPPDLTAIITTIDAIKGDTFALRDRATAIWQAQYTTLEEMQAFWDNTKISQLGTILQSILDVLQAQAPMDEASIITAIQAGTAETHEVVARLDYIGNQANLAAVKAAVLEVLARLDYIGDQANLAAVKAAIDALQAHLQAILNAQGATTGSVLGVQGQLNILNDILAALAALADLAAILEKVENLRHNVDNIWEKFNTLEWWLHNLLDENLDTPTSHIADRLNDVIGRLENVKDLLQQLIQATQALKPYNPSTDPTRWTASSDGMNFVPMGILPGLNDVISPFWTTPPLGLSYGASSLNIPQVNMLAAPAGGWNGWNIFVESSANVYATNYLSTRRYKTNEWHNLEGNEVLIIWVHGLDYVRVWLDTGVDPGGGGTSGGGGWGDPDPGTLTVEASGEMHDYDITDAGDNIVDNRVLWRQPFDSFYFDFPWLDEAHTRKTNETIMPAHGAYHGGWDRDVWFRIWGSGTSEGGELIIMNGLAEYARGGSWIKIPANTIGYWWMSAATERTPQGLYWYWHASENLNTGQVGP